MRSAMAAMVPHPCSATLALAVCFLIASSMTGRLPSVQRVDLISSLPETLRKTPRAAAQSWESWR